MSDKNNQNDQTQNAQSNRYYYIAPLNGFDPKDITESANKTTQQLSALSCNLSKLSSVSTIPVNGNLFASVSATAKLFEHLNTPDIDDFSSLSLDLLGCLVDEGGNEANLVSVLRPILHKVRDAYLRQSEEDKEQNPLKASDIKLFNDHMHTLNAGELKTLVKKVQGKLDLWLNKANILAQDTLSTLTQPMQSVTPPIQILDPAANNQPKNWYAPRETYTNIWQALQTIDGSKKANSSISSSSSLSLSTPNPALIKQVTQLQATLAKEIINQSGTEETQIGFFLAKLLEAITDTPEIEKTTAIVEGQPARIIEEKKEGIFEALASVCHTIGISNQCKDGNCGSETANSIGFALGEERINQLDFTLSGVLPLTWDRVYRSNLITYNRGTLGARWTNSYLSRIDIRKDEWLLNTADGRIVKLPKLKVGEAHRDGVNGFNLIYLNKDLISITFARDQLQLFQKQGNKHYKLALIRDNNHNNISLSYDHQHRLILVDNQINHHGLTFDYNDYSQITQVHLHKIEQSLAQAGKSPVRAFIKTVAQYEYDKQGNLVSVIDEHGDKRTFEYDDYHRITRYADRTGFGMNLKWQGKRHKAKAVSEYADDGSRAMRLDWQNTLRATTLTNGLGQSMIFFCDIDGYPVRNILSDGKEEWFFRDPNKNIIKKISSDGRATSFQYDQFDRVLNITANDSSKTFFEYDEAGNLIRTIDANGHTWRNQYDDKNNIIKHIDPKENITQFEYSEQGLLTSTTNPKGGINKFEYNEAGQLIKQTDCSNYSTQYTYDDKGQLICTQDAEGHIVKHEYNQRGQLTKTTYPDGTNQAFEYDTEGRLLASNSSTGQSNRIEYNKGFIPFMMTDAIGRKASIKRDAIGKPQQLNNANGDIYRWQYHPKTNELLKETSFSGKNTTYQYDSKIGELIQSQEEGSRPVHYQYDELGRLTKLYSENQTEQFVYDQLGQLIESSNSNSKNQYFYDAVGNLTKEIQEIYPHTAEDITTKKQYVWKYEYDALGNRTSTTRPDGQKIDYLVYGSGHIHGLLLNQQPLVDFERDKIHRETSRQLGNQIEEQLIFDQTGRLKKQNILGHQNWQKEYTYNQQALIRQINDTRTGTQTYEYDSVGRLIHANNKHAEEKFSYDAADNRLNPTTAQTQNEHHNTQQYNLENRFPNSSKVTDYRIHADIHYKKNSQSGNLLTELNQHQYKYDQRGNLTKKIAPNGKETLYQWNEFNQLTQVNTGNSTHHYQYDTFGRRISKTSTTIDQYNNKQDNTTYYLWEGDSMVLEEHNGQLKHYLYEPDSFTPLAQFTTNGHSQPEQVYFYHNDHLGTPELLTDEKGNIAWEQSGKSAFGQMKMKSYVHNLDNSIRFQGQYFDEETGLHYNRYRYYDPETGRYISEDPIKLAGGINLYNYPTNPVHGSDPLGLSPADQVRIKLVINNSIDEMISNGDRFADPLLRSLGNRLGKLDCGDQTAYVVNKLEAISHELDDTWTFTQVSGYGHSWGIAVSSNKYEKIWFDPRANEVSSVIPCKTCHGMKGAAYDKKDPNYDTTPPRVPTHLSKETRKRMAGIK